MFVVSVKGTWAYITERVNKMCILCLKATLNTMYVCLYVVVVVVVVVVVYCGSLVKGAGESMNEYLFNWTQAI